MGTSQAAHELLDDIVNALIEQSAPTERERALLILRREQSESAIVEMETSIERFNHIAARLSQSGQVDSNSALEALGNSIVTLVSEIEVRRLDLLEIEQQLAGSISPEDVIQAPTQADSPEPHGLLARALLVAVASGFLALIVAFVRAGFRCASQTPEGLQKVNRIRRAFWIKPKRDP